ncbi:MAG: glycosyltransferase, partial [Deltaproteobacteria bacterium]|nr:glycosyltransferase [Deltaproteobacteria bacterium]
MKICLDLRTAVGPMHGIARYGIELVRALQELDQVYQILILEGSQRLPDLGRHRSTRVIRCSVGPYSLLEQFWVPRLMARLRPDLYHCLTYGCPAFLRPPFLFTVHDLLPLTRRREFGWSRRFYFQTLVRAAARRSSRILVVSQYTLTCLSQWLPRASRKIRMVPSGGDHMRKIDVTEEDRSRFLGINPENRPFFLS